MNEAVRNLYHKYGIKIEHIWFEDETWMQGMESGASRCRADIMFFHGLNKLPDKVRGNLEYTLVSDLSESEEVLFKKIGKNYRYEIKRSEKENVEIRSFWGKEFLVEEALFERFRTTYNEMYQMKNLKNTFNEKLAQSYLKSNHMAVMVSFYAGEPYVFHSYIYNKDYARLLYSTSPFRTDQEMANMIGRMNKALHWADMKLFRRMGIYTYDWGGISNIEQPNGVDKFKMGFGGEIISHYNVLLGITLKGKIVCFLKDKIRG